MVAPSGPVDEERVRLGSAVLASWGFQVRLGAHVLGRHDDLPYLSAPDQTRADDLETAWCDPTVDAVWAARGGYGTQRMVDMIDFDRLRAAGPKPFVGFSDVTALHGRIGRELGQVTVHGPAVGSLSQLRDPETVRALRCLLEEPPESGRVLVRGRAAVRGEAAGRLWGGNLSLLATDVGTEPPPTDPVIMVLEEVRESGYRVDRMLTQLLRAGWVAHRGRESCSVTWANRSTCSRRSCSTGSGGSGFRCSPGCRSVMVIRTWRCPSERRCGSRSVRRLGQLTLA